MKVTGIRITNVLGVRTLDRRFAGPIVLFAGRNGAGKSSLQAAIRMALIGEPERVSLKKDYPQLVSDGAKEGEVVVTVAGEEATAIHLPLPEGKPTPWTTRPRFLEHCLALGRFAALAADERRSFLFELHGLKADGEAVTKRLIAKGCDVNLVERIAPRLKEGFPAAHKEAAEYARDSKGAWRGATGETWGKEKGGSWAPAAVIFGAPEREILERVRKDFADAQVAERDAGNKVAALDAKAESATQDMGIDEKKASRVKMLTEDLATSTKERDEWQLRVTALTAVIEAPAALACPHCGGLVMQDGFALKMYEGADSEAKSEARTKLPAAQESARVMGAKCQSLTRDLDEARGHAAKLEAAKAVKDRGPSPHEIEQAKETHRLAQDRARSLREEEARLSEAEREAEKQERTKQAAAVLHAEVLAWLAIADAVAPSGIPSEILASALSPFNAKLREAAVMTGWRQVAIDSDMSLLAEGRPYHLLSESEQWRVNAMIAYAISTHGPRFLMLDRLDVLDLNGRGEAIGWLTALVDQKRLDGAIVCATLKTPPTIEGIESFWLESGEVLDLKAAA